MWRWIKRWLFGTGKEPEARGPAAPPPRARGAAPRAEPPKEEGTGPAAEAVGFLRFLDDPPDAVALHDLGGDDRRFLAGVLKLVHEKRLEVPVLPRAAVEVSRLLAEGDPPVGRYVEVLEQDPSLSLEVLRAANSAFYGFRTPAKGVRDAVIRLGLHPVRGLLITAHLRARVLNAGPFRRHAGWLNDLSLALGRVFRSLAQDLGLDPEEAATRGLLFHVEHFIILGALGAVQTAVRRQLAPSDVALAEAFRRCGDRVRELAARAWDLPVLLPTPELDASLRSVRRAVVRSWAGEDPGEVPGLDPGRFGEALERVRPG